MSATSTITTYKRPNYFSLEEGDTPILHDSLFNHIPSACLETSLSLAILERPGAAMEFIDPLAKKFCATVDQIYETDLGLQTIDGLSLRQIFQERLFYELRSTGNQTGRQLDPSQDPRTWLRNEESVLTKLRAISALGKFIEEFYKKDPTVVSLITGVDLPAKLEKITTVVRNAHFKDPEKRKRIERTPIILGKAISQLIPPPQRVRGQDYNLSTGMLYHPDYSFTLEQAEIALAYKNALITDSAEGISRENQVITDLSRPGILTDEAMKKMPTPFKKSGLRRELRKHQYFHGNAINRWIQRGSYVKECWKRDLPAAGAQSGSVADIFLAVDCLRESSIYEDPNAALAIGVLATAWMCFGGYHSFSECYPIVQAIAENRVFTSTLSQDRKSFYREFSSIAKQVTSAGPKIDLYTKAYRECDRLPTYSKL